MSALENRRGFLCGLASLPLIGGGVALIGKPTAAAVPVTRTLLDSYETWLDSEHTYLRFERYGPRRQQPNPFGSGFEIVFRDRSTGEVWDTHHFCNPGSRFDHQVPQPSTRAAIILSAAGVPIGGAA